MLQTNVLGPAPVYGISTYRGGFAASVQAASYSRTTDLYREDPGDPGRLFSTSFLKNVSGDLGAVLTSPLRWDGGDWAKAGMIGGAIVGTSFLLDVPVRNFSQKHRSGLPDTVAGIFNPLGTMVGSYGLMLGSYLLGEISDSNKLKAIGLDGLSALISTEIVTTGIKLAVGRHRPFMNDGTYSFSPGSLSHPNISFPSGHTSKLFSMATVASEHLDHWWPYIPAVIVGGSRIISDKHWLSDVLTGAVLGHLIAKQVVGSRRKEKADLSYLD